MPNTDHQGGSDREHNRERQQVETSETALRVRAEVEALHAFFVQWFNGAVANDDDLFQQGFARRFDPGFVLIAPSGAIQPLAQLTKRLRAGHGSNPEFGIEIRDVVLRREIGDLVLVTYGEWQRGAKHASPPDNTRISTALLKADRVAPGGYAWLHVHECWLRGEHP